MLMIYTKGTNLIGPDGEAYEVVEDIPYREGDGVYDGDIPARAFKALGSAVDLSTVNDDGPRLKCAPAWLFWEISGREFLTTVRYKVAERSKIRQDVRIERSSSPYYAYMGRPAPQKWDGSIG